MFPRVQKMFLWIIYISKIGSSFLIETELVFYFYVRGSTQHPLPINNLSIIPQKVQQRLRPHDALLIITHPVLESLWHIVHLINLTEAVIGFRIPCKDILLHLYHFILSAEYRRDVATTLRMPCRKLKVFWILTCKDITNILRRMVVALMHTHTHHKVHTCPLLCSKPVGCIRLSVLKFACYTQSSSGAWHSCTMNGTHPALDDMLSQLCSNEAYRQLPASCDTVSQPPCHNATLYARHIAPDEQTYPALSNLSYLLTCHISLLFPMLSAVLPLPLLPPFPTVSPLVATVPDASPSGFTLPHRHQPLTAARTHPSAQALEEQAHPPMKTWTL